MSLDEDPERVRLPDAVVRALAREAGEPEGLLPAVMARIEALEASLDPRVVAALPRPAPSRPLEVMARVEALPEPALDARIVRAIAEDVARGFAPSLAAEIMERVEAEIERELAAEGVPGLAALREEVARESERMQAARVVSEVKAEVRSIGPRLEREMPRAVERRIADEAPRARVLRPAWGTRALAGLMAAAAALVLFLRSPEVIAPPELPPLVPGGEAHVDAVEFDGTVTVTESDGVAVIWLSDDTT